MRRVHVLRVEQGPEAFSALLAAAAAAGLRVGWLELGASPAPPPELRAALQAGGERAVAAGEGLTLVARRRRGEARLRDLLRTHFAGCAAVLVRGAVEAPLLAGRGADAWSVRAGDRERRLGTAELVAALREPRPFPPAEPQR